MTLDNLTQVGEQLEEALLANAVAPEPGEMTGDLHEMSVLANFQWLETGGKTTKRGLPMQKICADLFDLTGGWPKRVDKVLFVEGDNFRPRYLETPAQLMAWIDHLAFIEWARGYDTITPERFFAHLQETAEAYDALELFPHWPALPSTYYMLPELPATDGEHLDEFVDFFHPLTPLDRELIKALVISLAWCRAGSGGAARYPRSKKRCRSM